MRTEQQKALTRCQLTIESSEVLATIWKKMVNQKVIENHGHKQEFTDDYLELAGVLEAFDAFKTMFRIAESHPELVPNLDAAITQAFGICSRVFEINERFNILARAQIKAA
jgi:hypothetical protein